MGLLNRAPFLAKERAHDQARPVGSSHFPAPPSHQFGKSQKEYSLSPNPPIHQTPSRQQDGFRSFIAVEVTKQDNRAAHVSKILWS